MERTAQNSRDDHILYMLAAAGPTISAIRLENTA